MFTDRELELVTKLVKRRLMSMPIGGDSAGLRAEFAAILAKLEPEEEGETVKRVVVGPTDNTLDCAPEPTNGGMLL